MGRNENRLAEMFNKLSKFNRKGAKCRTLLCELAGTCASRLIEWVSGPACLHHAHSPPVKGPSANIRGR